jgi:hypothetical protein
MSERHKIQIDEPPPKACHLKIGDLAQLYIDFDLTPSSTAHDIVVYVGKPHITFFGVTSTPDSDTLVRGQRSDFFYAQHEGLYNVSLIPVIPGEVAGSARTRQ